MLKLKFRKLHTTVVSDVDPVNIINFLFQERISIDQTTALQKTRNDPKRQCTELMNRLHASSNPQAFVKLYLAVKRESHLQWLIDKIDNFDQQSLIELLQQLYISEPTGNLKATWR